MEIKEAINILEYYRPIGAINAGFPKEPSDDVKAYNLAIEALEKQAFFENEVDEIKDWFVDNKECLLDTATNVSTKGFNLLNKDGFIDDVDLDGILEDIVDEIQKGILNVLDTFIKD